MSLRKRKDTHTFSHTSGKSDCASRATLFRRASTRGGLGMAAMLRSGCVFTLLMSNNLSIKRILDKMAAERSVAAAPPPALPTAAPAPPPQGLLMVNPARRTDAPLAASGDGVAKTKPKRTIKKPTPPVIVKDPTPRPTDDKDRKRGVFDSDDGEEASSLALEDSKEENEEARFKAMEEDSADRRFVSKQIANGNIVMEGQESDAEFGSADVSSSSSDDGSSSDDTPPRKSDEPAVVVVDGHADADSSDADDALVQVVTSVTMRDICEARARGPPPVAGAPTDRTIIPSAAVEKRWEGEFAMLTRAHATAMLNDTNFGKQFTTKLRLQPPLKASNREQMACYASVMVKDAVLLPSRAPAPGDNLNAVFTCNRSPLVTPVLEAMGLTRLRAEDLKRPAPFPLDLNVDVPRLWETMAPIMHGETGWRVLDAMLMLLFHVNKLFLITKPFYEVAREHKKLLTDARIALYLTELDASETMQRRCAEVREDYWEMASFVTGLCVNKHPLVGEPARAFHHAAFSLEKVGAIHHCNVTAVAATLGITCALTGRLLRAGEPVHVIQGLCYPPTTEACHGYEPADEIVFFVGAEYQPAAAAAVTTTKKKKAAKPPMPVVDEPPAPPAPAKKQKRPADPAVPKKKPKPEVPAAPAPAPPVASALVEKRAEAPVEGISVTPGLVEHGLGIRVGSALFKAFCASVVVPDEYRDKAKRLLAPVTAPLSDPIATIRERVAGDSNLAMQLRYVLDAFLAPLPAPTMPVLDACEQALVDDGILPPPGPVYAGPRRNLACSPSVVPLLLQQLESLKTRPLASNWLRDLEAAADDLAGSGTDVARGYAVAIFTELFGQHSV